MFDRGLFLSSHAIRRQLAAMPQDLYLVRLIHHATRRAFPGERLWTAAQLGQLSTVQFLRIRNREGCDVYIQPYAENRNAGYILLDLDRGNATTLERMHGNGHQPCVVLQTSPGHLQVWIQVSAVCLEPATASAIARQLAHTYGGDLASADWRHLGRLAGFTNQKPLRRQSNGYAPWVRLLYAQLGLARNGASLVQAAEEPIGSLPSPFAFITATGSHDCEVAELLRCGSPGFPRHHADPENYLHRTVERALGELTGTSFPARARRALCGGGGDLAPPTLHHKVTR